MKIHSLKTAKLPQQATTDEAPKAPPNPPKGLTAQQLSIWEAAHTEHLHPLDHADRCGEPPTLRERQRIAQAGAPRYFRTYEQVKAAMGELAAKYPTLAKLQDIGDSWEKVAGKSDRDVLALRLTSGKGGDKAPRVVFVAGLHAREIANPELMMRLAKSLLEGYGTDARATSILDNLELCVVPMVNPDGHAVVERGYAGQQGGDLMQRKNTSNGHGVDLNRNYPYMWGKPGASDNPRSDTYRGASAGSEPETKAVMSLVNETKPTIFVDWHSYSQLVLYPWGYTKDKTPHHEPMKAISDYLSSFNKYKSQQAIDLYVTSGTTDDWVYAEHKIPALCLETGTRFHQTDADFEQTWKLNQPVMDYLARIAADPFGLVKGPDVQVVSLAGDKASATVSTESLGKRPIAAAEAVTDLAAAPGSGIPLKAADGQFNSAKEVVEGDVSALRTSGSKTFYVRAKDAQGNWGPGTPQWLS